MMGGGELKSGAGGGFLMQQMMWSGTSDSKNNMMSSLMPCAEEEEEQTNMAMPPRPLSSSSMLLLQQGPPELKGTATSLASDDLLHDDDGQESSMPGPWSQLLIGGLMVGDHERYSAATALLSKGLEEGSASILPQAATYNNRNFYAGVHGGEEIQTSSAGTNKSQVSHHHQQHHQMLLASSSSPLSCITTSLGSNMLGFSNSTPPPPPPPELRNHHHSDNSSESNSNATGSAPKKARVQTSSSAQSTLKVRKERLGDRITALHQIVSPFGKTDTASVLQETIGYIRFLLSQIEALSYPYLGHVGAGSGDSMQQHQQTALLNHRTAANAAGLLAEQHDQFCKIKLQDAEKKNGGGDEAIITKKDLRSRGLCLVPVSCTSHLADDNAASDFWAVAAAPPPAPPLGGIIWPR